MKVNGMDRFDFQRQAVEHSTGVVLNIGCNEDPAHLRDIYSDRVINCDAYEKNDASGQAYPVDAIFDCTEPWPFRDNSAELVVLGDIVEHLYPDELHVCLDEANRVAEKLCITVPEDHRVEEDGYFDVINDVPKGIVHVHPVTEKYLLDMLRVTGWEIARLLVIDYGFVPVGYLVDAIRVGH
jgi:hypothetical protein